MIFEKNLNEKSIYICGEGKLKEDFEFMFSHLNISGAFQNCLEKEGLDEIRKIALSENVFFVICSRKEIEIESELAGIGLQKGVDFCRAPELFINLESGIQYAKGKDIYIWGTGTMARELFSRAESFGISLDFIKGFIDSDKTKTCFAGYKVYTPDEIMPNQNIFYWIAVKDAYCEIKEILDENKLEEYKNYIQVLDFGITYHMMMQTYWDWPDKNNKFVCDRVTEFVGVNVDGTVATCCENLIQYPLVGNLFDNSFLEIWNSNKLKVHRLAIKNGTYSFCQYRYCPMLKKEKENDFAFDNHLVKELPDVIKNKGLFFEGKFDYTCNLYCSSCRNQVLGMVYDEKREFLINRIVNEIVPLCSCVQLAGNGEVFVSKQYKTILEQIQYVPHLSILSNGTKIDFQMLDELSKKCNKLSVKISVDAASEKTYGLIRRGGDFKKLVSNLEILSKLRLSGVIHAFWLNYVVQLDNVHEMEEFYAFGKKLKADCILYTTLQNWGTYTTEEFQEKSLWDENWKLKKEYIEFFCSPMFDDPIVWTDWKKTDIEP